MAGTIISTPAVGASSWVDFITQQGKTDKGFLRVSLTNDATTAASSIGTGSVMELAGSIYQFTETAITLAAGTPSAAQAIYYTVIPSAGGTTVTVVMEGTAPTWIDSKQGYYASAASLTRYIGGCDIATAGTYNAKWLYEGGPRAQRMLPKIGNSNRTTGGTQEITGIGFRPSVIMLLTDSLLANRADYSMGYDDSLNHHCLYMKDNEVYTLLSTTYSLIARSNSSTYYYGLVSSMDTDGFTITWIKVGTPSQVDFSYLCFP